MNTAAISGLVLFCLVSVASLFGRAFWLFELSTHFRVQYVVAGAALALVLLALRRRLGAAVSLAVAAAHAAPVYLHLSGAPDTGAEARETIRVVALNLRHRHGDVDAAGRLIRTERPDIVVLTEFLVAHEAMLGDLSDILPHRVGTEPRGKFDAVLLSRWPIAKATIDYPWARSLPVIEGRLCPAGVAGTACLTVIALHSPRPERARGEAQVKTLDFVARRAATIGDGRVIVAGDLNTTPFSPRFHDLLARGGLRDTADGMPWRTTWISRFPPFGLALDHVLVGPALAPRARRVAGDIGSDHFPLIVDMALEAVPHMN